MAVSAEKHYLAYRDKHGLRKVEIFRDQDEALHAYALAESFVVNHGSLELREECCLFGSDSLATLCRTHASWFAPETIDLRALCDQTTPRNPPQPSARVKRTD